MALEWLDGFDTYRTGEEAQFGLNNYSSAFSTFAYASNARTGANSVGGHNNNGWYILRTVPASTKKIAGAALLAIDNGAYNAGIFMGTGWTVNLPIGSGGTNAGCYGLQLRMATNGNIALDKVNNGAVSNLFTTTNSPIPYSAYSYLELVYDCTTGVAEIWYNGNVNLFNVSGITGIVTITQIALGQQNGTGSGQRFDDFYVDNANRLGAQRCYTLFVNSDDTPQDWTLSSGSTAYTLLNASQYVTTNYIQGSNVGDKANFGCQDLPTVNAVINGIRLASVQELDAAGSAFSVQHAFIGAAQYDGASFSPSTTAGYSNDIFTLGSSTVADINAMKIELEKTA